MIFWIYVPLPCCTNSNTTSPMPVNQRLLVKSCHTSKIILCVLFTWHVSPCVGSAEPIFMIFPHLFLKCLNTVKLETRHLNCQPFYAEIGDIHSLKYLFLFLILITRIQVEFFKKNLDFFTLFYFKEEK